MEMAFKEFNRITGVINGAYHKAALKLGLSDSEMGILYTLCAHEPGCNQSTLYKETGMTKSTVNSAIRKMEQADILYLTDGSGRNTRVFLTEKGKALTQKTVARFIRLENKIYESWSPQELEVFMRLHGDFAKKINYSVQNEL